ncbi:hypothetical protein HYPSUDRAFT_38115 [Hypholoma sublateritium FD-334 SS-4]|uniref:CENP-V/GFA domain-containing protein n=1 Tax=Hypholoma sublateritium (strain FD-334 SS-4) TaxID=945553 RepID=A0A0D2LCW7_HYPSF|nr:hypothetical protein HYPSUDRAFT_38115 [Hypholoma sublateritium FD-334 SS-4]
MASGPPPTSAVPVARTGSCLCRAVKYEVTGEPVTIRVCHCGNCKKATGAAFMTNGFFKESQVRILAGEDMLKFYADPGTASGTPLNRYFCGNCGSNVFLRSQIKVLNGKKNDLHIVALGTLDEVAEWKPNTEIFKEQKTHFVTGIEVQTRNPKL